MSNRTYLLRLIIPFAIMIVAVVALSGWLIYNSGLHTARVQQSKELQSDAAMLANVIRDSGAVITPAVVARAAEEARYRDVRLTIIAVDGEVLFDSHMKRGDLNNHNDRPEVLEARQRGKGWSVRESVSQGISNIYAAERVSPESGLVMRASRPERAPLVVSTRMIVQLAAAVGLSVLIMSWLALTLHRRWIAPVRSLAFAAEKMAAGEWQTRVKPAGVSELREFSGRLNFLAEQAQKQLDDLQHQRTDLSSLVDSLPDPILLTDPQQRLVLLNEPAARFVGVTPKQAVGAKIFSVLGDTSLLDVYEHVTSQQCKIGTPYMREFRATRGGQKFTYQAVAARTPAGGVLIVLRDITKMAATVQMKTDFVANASHELRTPIAAIKLAFETLSEVYIEEPHQTKRCIEIIAGHLHRLEEMLRDLLDLSRVETTDLKPEFTELRAADMLAMVNSTMGPIARDKGIELAMEGEENMHFESDRRLLDLVLKNLVENSIKYTPTGGRVTVRIAREGDNVLLRVSDTGIGIPPQHQERVFERFYQVDSARSGGAGRGTGLGLAIVKHAIHALAGQVKLDSNIGRGTTVTCILPPV